MYGYELSTQTISNITISKPIETIYETVEEDITNLDLKVLIVEDNLTNQKLLGFFLEELNAKFDIASDGIEAIECFQNNKYDIILMDENMPNMNGIEATKIIREIENNQKLKANIIVAITANALKGDRERFISSGMDDYISKPYSEEDIVRVLQKYFG